MKLLNTLLAAGAFAIASTSAHALVVPIEPALDDWATDGTCAVGDLDPAAADCFGLISATNDNNNGKQAIGKVDVNFDKFDGTLGLFGETDWVYLTKYEGTNYQVDGTMATFDIFADLVAGYGQIALGFKQGAGNDKEEEKSVEGNSQLVYYLYNAPFPTSSKISLLKFTNPGISHLTVHGRGEAPECKEGDPECTTPIPLPAAGWLLLGGLGGIAALRRRKKA